MDPETKKLWADRAINKSIVFLFSSEFPPEDKDGIVLTLDYTLFETLISLLDEQIDLYEKIDEGDKVFYETGLDEFVIKHQANIARISKYKSLRKKLKDIYRREETEIVVTIFEFYILCGLLQQYYSYKKEDETRKKEGYCGVNEGILIDVFALICKRLYGVSHYSEADLQKWLIKKVHERFSDDHPDVLTDYFASLK